MKTMTCNQLGGACDKKFHGETFDDIARQSSQHGQISNDRDHKLAKQKMKSMMEDPEEMQEWMESKRILFESLPDDE